MTLYDLILFQMSLKMGGAPRMPFCLHQTDDQEFVVDKLKDYQIPDAYNIFSHYANKAGEGFGIGEFGSLEYFKQKCLANSVHALAITEIKSGQLAFVCTIGPCPLTRSTQSILHGGISASNPLFRRQN